MSLVKEATKVVNDVLKMVGEEPIPLPKEGSYKQRLETLLDIYTERLIAKQPKYLKFKNKKDIPDMVVMYLNKMIEQESK